MDGPFYKEIINYIESSPLLAQVAMVGLSVAVYGAGHLIYNLVSKRKESKQSRLERRTQEISSGRTAEDEKVIRNFFND